LGAALLCIGRLAAAEPTSAQKETARSLMAAARQARENGDLEDALRQFSAADAVMSVPTTGYEVAVTQSELGKLLEARKTLLRVLSLPVGGEEPQPFVQARLNARTLLEQVSKRIGSIGFGTSDPRLLSGVEVTIDGEAVLLAMLGTPTQVNPGKHLIRTRAEGRELWREVDVGEGEAVQVPLRLDPPQGPPAAPSPAKNPVRAAPRVVRPEPRQQEGDHVSALAYLGGGLGVAGLGLGSFAGLSAIGHKSAAKLGCVDGKCPPATWSELDAAHRMATLSSIGFAIGALGVTVAVGCVLFDKPSRVQKGLLLSPSVGPQNARLSLLGSF